MEGKICPNCGVELDDSLESCPLCSGIPGSDKNLDHVGNYPSDILRMSAMERARYNWELSGIIAASGIMVSLIVDLVIDRGLSWSLYSITILAGIWVYITTLVFLRKRVGFIIPALALNTMAILVLVDLFKPPVDWFVPLAVPFTVSFFILAAGVLLLTKRARYKGFNVLAIIFIAIAIQCIVFEVFTDLYLTGTVHIEWSAITAAAIIPFSSILMFLHYRMKRGLNLKSYFHV